MLHEILLALLGHTGRIVVAVARRGAAADEADDGAGGGFEVSPDATFLPAAERQLINALVALGFYYRRLDRFVQRHATSLRAAPRTQQAGGAPMLAGGAAQRSGLYLRALCAGVDEVLDGYRAAVLRAEQDILAEPHHQYPLAKLRVALSAFELVLPPLHQLVDDVRGAANSSVPQRLGARGLHGGEILQVLYRRSLAGVPAVQRCMRRLLFHCHRVLFNQISAWTVNGIVADPFDEFFIEQVSSAQDASDAATTVTAPASSLPFASPPASLATASVAGGAAGAATSIGGVDSLYGSEHVNWNTQFRLRIAMLPTAYLPVLLAQKLLFIGKAVCILEHAHVQGGRVRASLLPHDDAVAFARALERLRERPEFDLLRVNMVVDAMRARVTRHLWQLVVEKAHLLDHLRALKDFLLVGRGEFFQAFIEAVEHAGLFDVPATEKAERDINDGPFQAAAQSVGIEENAHFKRFTLRLDKTSFALNHFSASNVSPYGESSAYAVAPAGAARRMGRALRLTGSGPSQLGAAWYGSRRVVDRGFKSTFRFSVGSAAAAAAAGAAGPGGAGGGAVPASPGVDATEDAPAAEAAGPAPRGGAVPSVPFAWGHGLSFVVQNSAMNAVPAVVAVAAPPVRSAHVSDLSLGLDAHHGDAVRYEGIPNSLEVYLHVNPHNPRENHVAVYARAPAPSATMAAAAASAAEAGAERAGEADERERSETLLLAHTRGMQGQRSVPAALWEASLARLGDGNEHVVVVEYVPPLNTPGTLTVFVDVLDAAHPVLQAEVALDKAVRLDGGRAWVGFAAASGYLPLHSGAADGRARTVRDVSMWHFQETEPAKGSSWRNVRLEYQVGPPVDLVLLTDDFDRYNALFRFLFLIKRVQLQLQRTWPVLMHTRRSSAAVLERLKPVYTLRAHMQFLVDNLQYYLQVDVLEVQFRQLVKNIEESRDFETVRRAHEEYLAELTKLCFLHNSVISRSLHRICENVFEFCQLLTPPVARAGGDESEAGELAFVDVERVRELAAEFRVQSSFFFSILARKTGYFSSHLAQLVLRIDFNRHYSQLAGKLGMTREQPPPP